jgi:hypothetical protein
VACGGPGHTSRWRWLGTLSPAGTDALAWREIDMAKKDRDVVTTHSDATTGGTLVHTKDLD